MTSSTAAPGSVLPARPARLHALTSTRFVAAFAVVLHHAYVSSPFRLFSLGYLGVTYFFVLSGFVLAWSQSTRHGSWAFYRNRFARIGPLHYLTLLAAIILPLTFVTRSLVTLAQNLTFTQAWTYAGARSFNWVSWSLSCEAFFYLLFPLLIGPITKLRNASLVATGILVIVAEVCLDEIERALHAPGWVMYDMPINRLGEFVLGICLAEFVRRELRVRRSVALGVLVAALLSALGVVVYAANGALPRDRASAMVLGLVVVVIYACARRELATPVWWLNARALRRLGDWSFALYMVHPLVLQVFATAMGRTGFSLPALQATMATVISLGLAAVACEFVERPLERRLAARRRDMPLPVPAVA